MKYADLVHSPYFVTEEAELDGMEFWKVGEGFEVVDIKSGERVHTIERHLEGDAELTSAWVVNLDVNEYYSRPEMYDLDTDVPFKVTEIKRIDHGTV